jgi:hypothetical protein
VIEVYGDDAYLVRYADGDRQNTWADGIREPTEDYPEYCPSLTDEITAEPLKERHVCWRSPDNSQRMCFNLSTLRKVALTIGKVTTAYTTTRWFVDAKSTVLIHS